jgi:hypothetical protein
MLGHKGREPAQITEATQTIKAVERDQPPNAIANCVSRGVAEPNGQAVEQCLALTGDRLLAACNPADMLNEVAHQMLRVRRIGASIQVVGVH